ncbi:MAG: Hsp20/alpha crystallin family protein [Anaerolineales bacterium]|nr:Hsp20/alpha crystallin family protein [Anaerolineales bacterium]
MAEHRRMLVETIGWQMRVQHHVWGPPTDLFETESAYIVRVEVAGMREQDFSVVLENNYLSISGNRSEPHEHRAYHQMEVRFGEFQTVVALPGPVEIADSRAEYEDGFLTISLPKPTSA